MADVKWTLVWLRDGGDFYVGETAALYRDGVLAWEGTSNDNAEAILREVLGEDIEVRRVSYRERSPTHPWNYFPEHLDDAVDQERPSLSPMAEAMIRPWEQAIRESLARPPFLLSQLSFTKDGA